MTMIQTPGGALLNSDRVALIRVAVSRGQYHVAAYDSIKDYIDSEDEGTYFLVSRHDTNPEAQAMVNRIFAGLRDTDAGVADAAEAAPPDAAGPTTAGTDTPDAPPAPPASSPSGSLTPEARAAQAERMRARRERGRAPLAAGPWCDPAVRAAMEGALLDPACRGRGAFTVVSLTRGGRSLTEFRPGDDFGPGEAPLVNGLCIKGRWAAFWGDGFKEEAWLDFLTPAGEAPE